MKGVGSPLEDLVRQFRVTDGPCHRERSDQRGQGQQRLVTFRVVVGAGAKLDEQVQVAADLARI